MYCFRRQSFWLVLVASFFFLAGCGASAPEADTTAAGRSSDDDISDIEELLGVQNEGEKKPEENNDEILTLLGADDKPMDVDAERQDSQQNTAAGGNDLMVAPVNNSAELQAKENEIKELRQELRNKDIQIDQLRASQANVAPATATVVVSDIPDAEYESLYQQGLALFESRQYQEAIAVFQRLIGANDRHPLADNAQYWIGESNYAVGNFQKAILDFEKVFTYANANKSDHAQFKLGKCYKRLGDKQRAREEYQRFLNNYPKSDLRSKAEAEIAGL